MMATFLMSITKINISNKSYVLCSAIAGYYRISLMVSLNRDIVCMYGMKEANENIVNINLYFP